VTLLGSFGSFPLAPYPPYLYQGRFDDTVPASFGETYGFSISGTTGTGTATTTIDHPFDPIELADVIVLPERLEVTAPTLAGGVLPLADLDLVWTGTSDGLVHLRLWVEPWYDVRCDLTDDGVFTVPASVLTLLPTGQDAILVFERIAPTLYGTAAGRTFRATGYTSHEFHSLATL
jgi:hypothetical protein